MEPGPLPGTHKLKTEVEAKLKNGLGPLTPQSGS
jgi:hypothetical protein